MVRIPFFLVCGTLSVLGFLAAALEESPKTEWQKVYDAIGKQLPQTAIQELEPLIKAALEAKNYPEAVKAIALKISLEGTIEGNKPEERITRLEAVLEQELPDEMKPTLEVILAHWYWQYFQQNRWRFMQRTATDQPPGEDINSWDLSRILAEIDEHFTLALQHEDLLRKTPVEKFDELLVKGTMPDATRPTMYDFAVHEALTFYTAGEQAGAMVQNAFVLQADSPIFAPTAEFLAWNIESPDTQSPTIKAVRLFQSLEAFHKDDSEPTALAEAELDRLVFGYNTAVGEDKNQRYMTALERFVGQWEEKEISARARAAWGQVLHGEQRLVEAREVALPGWQKFPESVGGQLCYNLIQSIEAKEMQVSTERVWNNPWPAIQVRYRNLTKVHLRAVRYDWEKLLAQENYSPGGMTPPLRTELLGREPDLAWSHDLPATEDYLTAEQSFPVPDSLKPGFYFLLASPHETFTEQDNVVLANEFWVSTLAVVLRSGGRTTETDGFVLDADTGQPLPGAQVRVWTRQRVVRRYQWKEGKSVRTDENGLFRVQGTANEPYVVLVKHGASMLASGAERYAFQNFEEPQPYEQTVFFTDRSLYRPGQTIQFKGICIAVDQQRDNYQTLSKKSITVVFEDANGQEIEKQQCRTNDFGSFNGSFTAPRDRLMGQMRIRDAERDNSIAFFNVEEYKRPKFKVELAAPAEPAKLHGDVKVEGTAKAYTGAPIGEAQVSYRVVREVRYPIWWFWRYWWNPPQSQSQEISHGTTTTDTDGKFTVLFPARPAPDVSEKDEPVFRFTVHADVTDITGETRSDQRSVNVGFTSLQASMTAEDWQVTDKEVAITVTTQSLDGEPQAAKGQLKVYRLKQPEKVHRSPLFPFQPLPLSAEGGAAVPDLSNINAWPLGEMVAEKAFATDASGTVIHSFKLAAGPYRALLETTDAFGKPVTAVLPITVLDPQADRLEIKIPQMVAAERWSVEPGKTFTALWGTGYEEGRAFVEVEHRGKMIQSYWTRPQVTQATVEQGITEELRGGFTVHVTYVRENRAYLESRRVDVPWTNKQLTLRWEHFVSKLKPGAEESWSINITGPQAEKAAVELVAALYDASLDAYLPHNWPLLQPFRTEHSMRQASFENMVQQLMHVLGSFAQDYKSVTITYRSIPPEIVGHAEHFGFRARGASFFGRDKAAMPVPAGAVLADGAAVESAPPADMMMMNGAGMGGMGGIEALEAAAPPVAPAIDLSKVSARQNLSETAFFFPHLTTDADGRVTLKFTMPEALTEWKFLGYAHDQQLRGGALTDTAVTSKDLMVEPLAPRFVREGDVLEFTVKVTNQSAARQTGTVQLTLADARTLESVDQQLGNVMTDQPFDIASKQSRSFSWRLQVPDGLGFLTYKAVGSTGKLSDGEEGYLPVLSRRILVRESLPLPIRGASTKKFEFTKLLESAGSDSLQHQSLTVQMVSNPAWYAVLALPYLMEYPYECTEQTFNRLYANALARHIANADPKIRRVFDQWKGTEALESPLEKNQDLKAVMLEETPWVREALKESEARRNVGILFDANRLNEETARSLRKLVEVQEADGSWPWFPGGRPNDYITLYITTGFGRLRHLGADIDVAPAVRSLARLDTWIDERYRKIVADGHQDKNNLSPTIALYLYGRSFFLDDQQIAPQHQEAIDFFLKQARTYWTKLSCRQSEAHLAIALKRFADKQTPEDIMKSLKERSVSDEELGMFWRDTERSWWWYHAPIETQALMIEAFDEVVNDAESVEACRVWLLKQKQTQDWKTTKATADAVYSLLLRGTDLLASDALVRVRVGDLQIEPKKVEVGTGFYEQRFVRDEVKPAMGQIEVTKTDPGVAWGSVHWQYLEDMAKITPYEGTPLTLRKMLYVKEHSETGPMLRAVSGPVSVGDELVVRVELRVDRDMEYVHLKDQRGSGVEPVNVLSHYRFQDGLAYYESTRDTASHFFIDYLPKGTYVFEYSTRVVHRGEYQSGIAEIQCMYAPEFNSHSESVPLQVQ
ncbi:MAG: alpha-2-macroglobulin family protein [Pirellulaceae bacterium]